MATLKLGSKGQDVEALQQTLIQKGFSPGAVDGDFGSGRGGKKDVRTGDA
jgi:peptidoglycan hydrolase-like protein with peptidoglycan-binding domain